MSKISGPVVSMFPIFNLCSFVEFPYLSVTTPAKIFNVIFPPFSFLYLAVSPTIGFIGVTSVYPAPSGDKFDNTNVYSYSWFSTTSVGPSNDFTIAVDSLSFTSTLISSLVKLNILESFSKNLSFTLNFTFPLSASISGIDHTGSTTSTIVPLPLPSGSSFPIVIVLSILVFPVLSVMVPAVNDNDIYPLYL